MNEDLFLRYVGNTRDCEPARLDAAVNKGLRRAKSGGFDFGKLAMLAAACAFTAVMCFTVNLKPFKSAAEGYYRDRQETMPDAAEALDTYMKNISGNLRRYLGG